MATTLDILQWISLRLGDLVNAISSGLFLLFLALLLIPVAYGIVQLVLIKNRWDTAELIAKTILKLAETLREERRSEEEERKEERFRKRAEREDLPY